MNDELEIVTHNSLNVVLTFSYAVASFTYYAQIRDLDGTLICNLTTTKSGTYDVIVSLTRALVDTYFDGNESNKYVWGLKQVSANEIAIVDRAKVVITKGTVETP